MQRSSHSGSGYIAADSFAQSSDVIGFTVNASSAGSYTLKIGYSGVFGSKVQKLSINNGPKSDVSFPSTTNSNPWSEVSVTVNLSQGNNDIRLLNREDGTYIDRILVTSDGLNPPN